MVAHIIAIAMQKGGVGKTTTTASLGVNLAQNGHKVLLIDIDHQSNLTSGLGINPDKLEYSVYEVLLQPERGLDYALVAVPGIANLDLIPATLDLAGAELELAGKVGRELLLKEALTQAQERYDFIIIDSPPSLGTFTLNALAAANSVIVPLQTEAYAFKALGKLEQTIKLVKKLNRDLELGGIVCTMYDKRTNLSQTVEEQARKKYAELVFKTVIPRSVKLAESPAAGQSIAAYAPNSPGAKAYEALAKEVEERYGRR